MRTRLLSTSVLCSMLFSLVLFACGPVTAADAPPKPPATEEEKTLYALGLMLSRNLQAFELTPAELGFVMQGINDGASGKETAVKMEEYAPKVQALGQAKSDKRAAAEKAKSQAFLAAEAAKPGVVEVRVRDALRRDPRRHRRLAASRPTRSRSTTAARSSTAPSSTARSPAGSRRSSR